MKEIDKILAHQNKRFKDLETILSKNPIYHLKFPGRDADHHALGTGIAKSSWSPDDHNKMVKNIAQHIKTLSNKYPGRISFGMIGDYKLVGTNCDGSLKNPEGVPGAQADGTFVIHVWGANDGNFNFENNHPGSFGLGQASCFSHQRPGVFGISTMPGGDESVLMAPDKLLALY